MSVYKVNYMYAAPGSGAARTGSRILEAATAAEAEARTRSELAGKLKYLKVTGATEWSPDQAELPLVTPEPPTRAPRR